MNKIFKCKYDVTSGVTKVVSELATNQQLASQTTRSTPPPPRLISRFLSDLPC